MNGPRRLVTLIVESETEVTVPVESSVVEEEVSGPVGACAWRVPHVRTRTMPTTAANAAVERFHKSDRFIRLGIRSAARFRPLPPPLEAGRQLDD